MRRALLLAGAAVCALGCRSPARASSGVAVDAALEAAAPVASLAPVVDAGAPAPELPNVASEWCTEGLSALDEGTCYLVPPGATKEPRTLLIYLHGTIPPSGGAQRKHVHTVVSAHARKHGYVALLPRGRRGIGPNKIPEWWAWPTAAIHHTKYAREMVESWLASKKELEKVLGPFARTYLAGSSNGAYFLTVLALKGEIAVDGFGAMSGGSWSGRIPSKTVSRSPFYVGYGTHDESKTGPVALGEFLGAAKWPHRVGAHPTGHGAREVYLDEAFELWSGAFKAR